MLNTIKEMSDLLNDISKQEEYASKNPKYIDAMKKYYSKNNITYLEQCNKFKSDNDEYIIDGHEIFMQKKKKNGAVYFLSLELSNSLIEELLTFNIAKRIIVRDKVIIEHLIKNMHVSLFNGHFIIIHMIDYIHFSKLSPDLKALVLRDAIIQSVDISNINLLKKFFDFLIIENKNFYFTDFRVISFFEHFEIKGNTVPLYISTVGISHIFERKYNLADKDNFKTIKRILTINKLST